MPVANVLSPISVPEPVPQLLRDLIHERTGIYFEADRYDTLLEKLHHRAVARGCASFLDYYYILRYEENNESEWHRVMDAFSVQETYFWREFDQVRALTDVLVPAWFRQGMSTLRIWSAACATGEEPYSIAMALEEAGWGSHPIEIWASDASDVALDKAREAVFRERSFRALPAALRAKYFREVPSGFELDRDIAARVRFRWANLVEAAQTIDLASSPVIFCRNVFIYFSAGAIRKTTDIFAERMPTGGNLFIGASESLLKITDNFDLAEINGAFVYRRKPRMA